MRPAEILDYVVVSVRVRIPVVSDARSLRRFRRIKQTLLHEPRVLRVRVARCPLFRRPHRKLHPPRTLNRFRCIPFRRHRRRPRFARRQRLVPHRLVEVRLQPLGEYAHILYPLGRRHNSGFPPDVPAGRCRLRTAGRAGHLRPALPAARHKGH